MQDGQLVCASGQDIQRLPVAAPAGMLGLNTGSFVWTALRLYGHRNCPPLPLFVLALSANGTRTSSSTSPSPAGASWRRRCWGRHRCRRPCPVRQLRQVQQAQDSPDWPLLHHGSTALKAAPAVAGVLLLRPRPCRHPPSLILFFPLGPWFLGPWSVNSPTASNVLYRVGALHAVHHAARTYPRLFMLPSAGLGGAFACLAAQCPESKGKKIEANGTLPNDRNRLASLFVFFAQHPIYV